MRRPILIVLLLLIMGGMLIPLQVAAENDSEATAQKLLHEQDLKISVARRQHNDVELGKLKAQEGFE